MSTPYSDVYSYFLSKITDYSFLNLSQVDLETTLLVYMKTAITKFDNCKNDLSDRNDTTKIFNKTLSDKEKDILGALMVVEYLRPKVVTSELYRIAMSDPDYKIYSQANQIDKLITLYKTMQAESERLMTKYSYYKFNLDGFV
jgi:hypothetical protein